jgi:hypothetical protein
MVVRPTPDVTTVATYQRTSMRPSDPTLPHSPLRRRSSPFYTMSPCEASNVGNPDAPRLVLVSA